MTTTTTATTRWEAAGTSPVLHNPVSAPERLHPCTPLRCPARVPRHPHLVFVRRAPAISQPKEKAKEKVKEKVLVKAASGREEREEEDDDEEFDARPRAMARASRAAPLPARRSYDEIEEEEDWGRARSPRRRRVYEDDDDYEDYDWEYRCARVQRVPEARQGPMQQARLSGRRAWQWLCAVGCRPQAPPPVAAQRRRPGAHVRRDAGAALALAAARPLAPPVRRRGERRRGAAPGPSAALRLRRHPRRAWRRRAPSAAFACLLRLPLRLGRTRSPGPWTRWSRWRSGARWGWWAWRRRRSWCRSSTTTTASWPSRPPSPPWPQPPRSEPAGNRAWTMPTCACPACADSRCVGCACHSRAGGGEAQAQARSALDVARGDQGRQRQGASCPGLCAVAVIGPRGGGGGASRRGDGANLAAHHLRWCWRAGGGRAQGQEGRRGARPRRRIRRFARPA